MPRCPRMDRSSRSQVADFICLLVFGPHAVHAFVGNLQVPTLLPQQEDPHPLLAGLATVSRYEKQDESQSCVFFCHRHKGPSLFQVAQLSTGRKVSHLRNPGDKNPLPQICQVFRLSQSLRARSTQALERPKISMVLYPVAQLKLRLTSPPLEAQLFEDPETTA